MNGSARRVVGGIAFVVVTASAICHSSPAIPRPRSAAAEQATDPRQRIQVSPAERDAVLAEMRTMLRSLSRILHGLAFGDLAMVEEAARSSGTKSALDPELVNKLPLQFQQLARRVHQRFDQLADAVRTPGRKDDALKRAAALTGYCVTCHDAYRLEEKR